MNEYRQGVPCWVDLATSDLDGDDVGGIWAVGDAQPHWRVYFGVAATDATAVAVRAAGGRVDSEPTDTDGHVHRPTGRFVRRTERVSRLTIGMGDRRRVGRP